MHYYGVIVVKVNLSEVMYVCICHGVTDKQIEQTIENGAETIGAISQELKVGTQCGQCCSCTKKILNSKLMQIGEAQPAVA